MSTFAVAAFHDAQVPAGTARLDATIWIRADGVEAGGVEASLRVWVPAEGAVAGLREVAPGTADLLGAAARVDDRTIEVAAGRWEDGPREYELALVLPAGHPGEHLLAARVGVVVDAAVVGTALVAVAWAAAPAGGAAPPAAGDVATGDLPTGASPEPRHTSVDSGGEPCRRCGAQPAHGDRYCEACGRELG